jgi:tetratricopeptide (TPR) repeat protein
MGMTDRDGPLADDLRPGLVRNDASSVDGVVVQAGSISGGVTINLPSPRVPVPRQLPAEVFAFTDRQDPILAMDALLSAAGPARVTTVSGTAGVGKTALAVHWSHRVRDRFPDGQLYIDLQGHGPLDPLDPADVLDQFLRALGVDGDDMPTELVERAARFRTVTDLKRMLVLLDNAGTAEQVRPLLPGSASCFVIVTSRDTLSGLVAREGARRIDLDLLAPADAASLLSTLVGARADEDPAGISTLVRYCARLPLAIRITAELIVDRPVAPISDLVHELSDERERLDLLDAGIDAHTAVRAVFSWSYRHLPEAAMRLFRLAGLHPGKDIDTGAIAALADVSPRIARQLAQRLSRANLFEEFDNGRYRMHDLLRVYAVELAGEAADAESTDAALSRLFGYYLRTGESAPDPVAWLETERHNLVAIVTAVAGRQSRHTIDLATFAGPHLNSCGYHDDGFAIHTLALAAARQLDDRAAKCHALNSLGIVHRRLGRFQEALNHHELALTGARETAAAAEEARALDNLGLSHLRLGNYRHAAELHRHALTRYADVGRRAEEGRAHNNLGIVLRRLGQHQEAFDHHHHALAIAREVGERINEGRALTSLGLLHRRFGNHDQAIESHLRALEIYRAAGNRVGAANALTRLGIVHEKMGDDDISLRYFGEALDIHHATGNVRQMGRSLNNIGIAYRKQGRHDEALRHLTNAIETHRLVGNRVDEAHALNALGLTLLRMGRHHESVDHLTRAVAMHESTGNQVDRGHTLNSLGAAYRVMGQDAKAVEAHREALSVAEQTGNHQLETATRRHLDVTDPS